MEPIITPPVGSVLALASNPWAPVIAVSTPRQILLYRTDRLQLAGVLPNDTGVAQSLSFSRNGQLLLASGGRGGESGSVLMFNARTGELIDRVGQERDAILTADLSADQSLIAIGSPNKRVAIMTSAGDSVHELKRHTDWVTAVGFSPDGQFLATADRNGSLLLWESESGLFVQKLDGHTKAITSLRWRSDGQFFVTASEDGSVRIWNTRNPKPVRSWNAHGGGSLVAGFRRDGSVYSAGRDRLVKLWQADGKAIRAFKGLQDIVVAATVCDETKRVFAADWSGKLLAWNLDDGKVLKTLSANPPRLAQRLSNAMSDHQQAQAKVNAVAANSKNLQVQISLMSDKRKNVNDQLVKTTRNLEVKAELKSKLFADRQHYSLTNLRRMQSLPNDRSKLKKLETALSQSKLALSNLPKDQRLIETVAYLESEIKLLKERIRQFSQIVFSNFRQHVRSSQQLRKLRQQTNQLDKNRGAILLQVNQLGQQLQELNRKSQQQVKAKTTAEQQVSLSQNAIARWQNEIQFEQKRKQLNNQLVEVESQLTVNRQAIQQAQQKRKLADQQVKQAQQARETTRAKAKAIQDQLRQLQKQ